jgi:hypothetical protein
MLIGHDVMMTKSTIGFDVFFGSYLISWGSQKQASNYKIVDNATVEIRENNSLSDTRKMKYSFLGPPNLEIPYLTLLVSFAPKITPLLITLRPNGVRLKVK